MQNKLLQEKSPEHRITSPNRKRKFSIIKNFLARALFITGDFISTHDSPAPVYLVYE